MFQVMAVLALASVCFRCSDDSDSSRRVKIEPVFSSNQTVEILTRATGDQRYGDYIPADTYPIGTKIGVMFMKAEGTYSVDYLSSSAPVFTYHGLKSDGTADWRSNVYVDGGETYTVFGHVPHDCCTTCTYYNDKTQIPSGESVGYKCIIMEGIKPVNNTDVSVVVGVGKDHYYKNAVRRDTINDEGAYPCNFSYLTATENNKIYLLMDHLFAQTRFHFAIGNKYHQLRDIRIRKVTLAIPEIKTLNAKIYLDDENPYKTKPTAIHKIDWTFERYTGEGSNTQEAVIYDTTEGSTLQLQVPTGCTYARGSDEYNDALADERANGYQLIEVETREGVKVYPPVIAPGFFTPIASEDQPVTFKLSVEYDVYDKKGTITRKGAKAVNYYTSTTKDKDNKPVAVVNGNSYDIDITVEPTYLYTLSDGDLDNPGMTINVTTNP